MEVQADVVAECDRPRNGPGHSPGSKATQFKPGKKPLARQEEQSSQTLLQEMIEIAACRPVANNTLTRALRQQFKREPLKFAREIQKMQREDAQERARAPEAEVVASVQVDETEEKLLGLIDQLRGEYQGRTT